MTKGGFYWHFDGRAALLDEMLDTWERMVVDDAIALVEREEGDARAKLERLFALPFRGDVLAVELAVRDWARRDAAVAARMSARRQPADGLHAHAVRGFVDDEDEVEARCLLTLTLFVGTALRRRRPRPAVARARGRAGAPAAAGLTTGRSRRT